MRNVVRESVRRASVQAATVTETYFENVEFSGEGKLGIVFGNVRNKIGVAAMNPDSPLTGKIRAAISVYHIKHSSFIVCPISPLLLLIALNCMHCYPFPSLHFNINEPAATLHASPLSALGLYSASWIAFV